MARLADLKNYTEHGLLQEILIALDLLGQKVDNVKAAIQEKDKIVAATNELRASRSALDAEVKKDSAV